MDDLDFLFFLVVAFLVFAFFCVVVFLVVFVVGSVFSDGSTLGVSVVVADESSAGVSVVVADESSAGVSVVPGSGVSVVPIPSYSNVRSLYSSFFVACISTKVKAACFADR